MRDLHRCIKLLVLSITAESIVASGIFAQGEEAPAQVPKVSSFGLIPDNLGAIGSSVNLFTGDVNLPLSLISLPGRNGLDVNVSILYNSNVQNAVDTRNLEAPTGILGLGWSMGNEMIVVDHKNTGSRSDDEFYLVAGGASNLLVRTGTAGDGSFIYEPKNCQFWKIHFYSSDERWEITKENGFVYVYGEKVTTPNRNTVQWGVKWGNWIGSSSLTSGQQQFIAAWNLSRIKNILGQEILFTYLNVDEAVGSGGLAHTTASYLKKIEDTVGRTIVFNYAEKYGALNPDPGGKIEYEDPYAQAADPGDAYQEKFETKFLNYIEVFAPDETDLFSIHFGYDQFLGSQDLSKRLLTSVTYEDASSNSNPNMKFEYNLASPYLGTLRHVVLPQGGSATFTYTSKTIQRARRDFQVDVPTASYPNVFTANDYCVITWLNTSTHVLRVNAHLWDGEWVKSADFEIPDVEVVNQSSKAQSFAITLEDDFFAIVNNLDRPYIDKAIYLAHKSPDQRGGWHFYSSGLTISGGGDGSHGALLASGDNFVVVLGKEKGAMYRFRWNGSGWHVISDDETENDADDDFFLAGTNNYFIRHFRDSNPDLIDFYYLDEYGTWTKKTLQGLGFNSELGAKWQVANSFAVVIADNTPEYIYRWAPDFSSFYRDAELAAIDDRSDLGVFDAEISTHLGDENSKALRFTGNSWTLLDIFPVDSEVSFGLGSDLFIRRRHTANGWVQRWTYDPNAHVWTNFPVTGLFDPKIAFFNHICAWYTDSQATISRRGPNGWSDTPISQWNSGAKLQIGNEFYVFEGGPPHEPRIGFCKNGQWQDHEVLDEENDYLSAAYGNTAVTRNNSISFSASSFRLHRVIDEAATGALVDYPVKSLALNDGYQTTYTYYLYDNYDNPRATYDASASVAQYNEVEVISGTPDSNPSDGIDRPSGSVKYYFFNGLPYDQARLVYPPNDLIYTNARDYYNLLKGQIYATKVLRQDGSEISSSTNYWWVTPKTLGIKDVGTYVRLKKTEATREGIQTIQTSTYNMANGLVSSVTQQGDDGNLVTETAYAFQQTAYNGANGMDDKNMLSQVYSTTVYKPGSTPTYFSKNWTTWEYASGYWRPRRIYVWKGTGTPPTDPDASTAIETTQLQYDSYGNVKQTDLIWLPENGAYQNASSTIWAHDKTLPIATGKNVSAGGMFFDDFERDGLQDPGVTPRRSYTGPPTETKFDGKFWHITGSKYHILSTSYFQAQNTVVEFDVRLLENNRYHTISLKDNVRGVFEQILEWSQDGYLRRNSSQNFNPHLPYVANKWYHVRIETYMGSNSFSVRVDGQKLVAGSGSLVFIDPNYDGLSEIHYLTESGGAMDIDNVRVYPTKSKITASTTYDPTTHLVTQSQDMNGVRTYYSYDDLYRPTRVDDNWGRPLVEHGYFNSREHSSNDTFDSSKPNATWQVEFFDRQGHDTFIDGANWNQFSTTYPATFGRLEVDGDIVVEVPAVAGSIKRGITSKMPLPANDVFVRVDFKKMTHGDLTGVTVLRLDDASQNGISIIYRPDHQKFRVVYGPSGSLFVNFNLAAPNNNDQWYTVLIYKYTYGSETRCTTWVYPRGKGMDWSDAITIGGFPSQWTPNVSSSIKVAPYGYYLANFYRGNARSIISYSDGLGRSIQEQAHLGGDRSISGTIYDSRGLPVKTYTLKSLVDNDWQFVLDWWQAPSPIYVQETKYDDTPLQRVKRSHASQLLSEPDPPFTEYSYDTNVANEVPEKAAGTLFRTKITDPKGSVSYSYSDKLGRPIAAWTLLDGANNDQFSHSIYDAVGRITEQRSPEYYSGEYAGATDNIANMKSTSNYNTLGQVTSSKVADESDIKEFLYDRAGNLRFARDAKQADFGEFTYYLYDVFNRLIEEGVCINPARFSQTYAENTTWPTTSDAADVRWKIRRSYDWNYFWSGTVSYDYGRVAQEQVNTDPDIDAEIIYIYCYDEFGNTSAVKQTIEGVEKTVSYEYDLLGNPTRISYPTGKVIDYRMDNAGRLSLVRRQN